MGQTGGSKFRILNQEEQAVSSLLGEASKKAELSISRYSGVTKPPVGSGASITNFGSAGGLLSGKYSRDMETKEGRRVNFDFPPINKDKAFDIIDEVAKRIERM